MRAQRYKRGSVRFDKRRGTWNYLWYESGKRRSKLIGTKQQYPNKSVAWKAVESAIKQMPTAGNALTVANLVEHYRQEKMPTRYSTRRAYEVWLRRRILPRWGDSQITNVQARPVELWLQGLNELAPKSRAELRGLLRILWEYAMWRGDVPTQRNPMELVRVKDVTKRRRIPRSLTVQEFHDFSQHLGEPFRTVALVCVCFGLRISECLALQWSDVDWLQGKLRVERGIVRQHVGDVKSAYSQRHMTIDAEMLQVLNRLLKNYS